MFGENSFCSIFVLSTTNQNIGVIEFANEEVYNLFRYTAEQLKGKNINIIIPRDIAKVHN